MIYALFICFIWALAWLYFDSSNTIKGIKAGVGIEGNSLITHFWGPKPTLWQLWSVDGMMRLAFYLAAQFVPSSAQYPHALQAMGMGALIACGFKNWQGGRQWKWMLANPTQKLPIPKTAWGQFLGFWG